MKRTIRQVVVATLAAGIAAFCACGTLKADTIPLDANCKVGLAAYMNGRIMISMTCNSGGTASTLTDCEITYRQHGSGDDWSTPVWTKFNPFGPNATSDKPKGRYCSYQCTLYSNVDLRFRAHVVSGTDTNSTDWILRENVTVPTYSLAKHAKYSLSTKVSSGVEALVDGAQNGVVELTQNSGGYLQIDLGDSRPVKGLRLVPRMGFLDGNTDRIAGAAVTVSDNADMSEATTVIASTAVTLDQTTGAAVEWDFSEAVSARYVRVTVGTKVLDIYELEPYAEAPIVSDFGLTVSQNAYNDAHPLVNLTAPWPGVDGWTLQRAFSASGPWDTVATGDMATTSVVDTVPKTVGAVYYYRATFAYRTRSATSQQYTTDAVAYRFSRCIERDWTEPTELYSGIAVLTDCQNTSGNTPSKSFDGRVDTYNNTTANPLVGLDFSGDFHLTQAFALSRSSGYAINTPISLWGSNETPTNTPSVQAEDDPNYTELYRTTEDGGTVFSNWYRFPVPSASQSTTYHYGFFHKNATDAADVKWGSWGNLAEGTFYGYTDADVTAAQLIAPETFVGTRTETGFSFVWTRGYNATAYVLQRKQNDGDWEDIKTFGADELSTTDEVSALSGSTIAYRIKVEKDSEIRYSDVFSQFFYVRGNGTGLLATYTAPSPAGSADPDEVRLGTNSVTGINITKADGETIYGDVADNILVEWKGKLIVPFTGDFAFQAKATDGFLLEIDGDLYLTDKNVQGNTDTSAASILNSWSTTDGQVTTRTSETISLTAGEHQLRAWWNPTTGAKSCVLYWSPAGTTFEVIPTTQFLPATEPDPETYGTEDWRYKVISSAHGYIRQVLDDRFVISEYGKKNATARSFRDGSFIWKKVSSRNFTLQADLYAPQLFTQWGCIFVSKNLNGGFCGDDATLILYRQARRDGVNVRHRTGAGTGQPTMMLTTDHRVSGSDSSVYDPGYIWLRLVRNGSHFEMLARQGLGTTPGGVASGAAGQWQTVATYDDTEDRFGDDVYIGCCSTADPGDWVYQGRYVFSNVRVSCRRGLTIIFK